MEGYQNMPVLYDNTQCWMMEIFDGFGPHISNEEEMKGIFKSYVKESIVFIIFLIIFDFLF